MKEAKTGKVAEALINKMFEIAGHDVKYQDIVGRKDKWFHQWSMTLDQQKTWVKWGVDYMHKELRMPKFLAEREMDMFNFNYGLILNTKNIKTS